MMMDKQVRDCVITINLTEEEKEAVCRLARKADRSVGGFVRWIIMQEIEKES